MRIEANHARMLPPLLALLAAGCEGGAWTGEQALTSTSAVEFEGQGTWADNELQRRTEFAIPGPGASIARDQNFTIDGILEGRAIRTVRGIRDQASLPWTTYAGLTMSLGVAAVGGVDTAQPLTLHTPLGDRTGTLVLTGAITYVGDVSTTTGSVSDGVLEIVGGTGELASVRGRLFTKGRSFTEIDADGTRRLRSVNRYCITAILCDVDPCPLRNASCTVAPE